MRLLTALVLLVLAATGCSPQLVPLATEAGVNADEPVAVAEALAADPGAAAAFLSSSGTEAGVAARWEALFGARLPADLLAATITAAAEGAGNGDGLHALLAAAAEGLRQASPDSTDLLAVTRGLAPAMASVELADTPDGTHDGVDGVVEAVYGAADTADEELLAELVTTLLAAAVDGTVATAVPPTPNESSDDYLSARAEQLAIVARPATLGLLDAVGAERAEGPIMTALATLNPVRPDPIPLSLVTLILQRLLAEPGMREALLDLRVFVTEDPEDGTRLVPFDDVPPFEGGVLLSTELGRENFIFWVRDAFAAELERRLR